MKKMIIVGFRSQQENFMPKDSENPVSEDKSFKHLESDIIYFSAGPAELKGTLLKQKPYYSA